MIKKKKYFDLIQSYKKQLHFNYYIGFYTLNSETYFYLNLLNINFININYILKKNKNIKNLNNISFFYLENFFNLKEMLDFLNKKKEINIYPIIFKLNHIIFFNFLKVYYFIFFSFKLYFIFLFFFTWTRILYCFLNLKNYGNITANS